MAALMQEVARFKEWANAYPAAARSGEWECDYPNWGDLHDAVREFLRLRPFASWSPDERSAVLYAVARDNEVQYLAGHLREHHAELLLPLTAAAIELGESDAKWQLAEELGRLGPAGAEAERLLILLARDEAEYVRRKSLESLARLGAPATEELAIAAWHCADADQQWARMMVLWCLQRIGSAYLAPLLIEAERDERPHLAAYAHRVRKGEVDD